MPQESLNAVLVHARRYTWQLYADRLMTLSRVYRRAPVLPHPGLTHAGLCCHEDADSMHPIERCMCAHSFWKYLANLDRRETRLYLQMFYILMMRPLIAKASAPPSPAESLC